MFATAERGMVGGRHWPLLAAACRGVRNVTTAAEGPLIPVPRTGSGIPSATLRLP